MEEIEEDLFPTRCRACAQIQECSQKMISMFEKDISEMFTKCTSLEVITKKYFISRKVDG